MARRNNRPSSGVPNINFGAILSEADAPPNYEQPADFQPEFVDELPVEQNLTDNTQQRRVEAQRKSFRELNIGRTIALPHLRNLLASLEDGDMPLEYAEVPGIPYLQKGALTPEICLNVFGKNRESLFNRPPEQTVVEVCNRLISDGILDKSARKHAETTVASLAVRQLDAHYAGLVLKVVDEEHEAYSTPGQIMGEVRNFAKALEVEPNKMFRAKRKVSESDRPTYSILAARVSLRAISSLVQQEGVTPMGYVKRTVANNQPTNRRAFLKKVLYIPSQPSFSTPQQ